LRGRRIDRIVTRFKDFGLGARRAFALPRRLFGRKTLVIRQRGPELLCDEWPPAGGAWYVTSSDLLQVAGIVAGSVFTAVVFAAHGALQPTQLTANTPPMIAKANVV
jgi:hypothetical protein